MEFRIVLRWMDIVRKSFEIRRVYANREEERFNWVSVAPMNDNYYVRLC